MKIIEVRRSQIKDITEVRLTPDFKNLDYVEKRDCLVDVIQICQKAYDDLYKERESIK
jgi:hypothetical protein